MTKRCNFNREWLTDPDFKDWLVEVPDAKRAKCNLCRKDINLAAMGISALKSHAKGDTHKKNVDFAETAKRGQTLINFMKPAATPEATPRASTLDNHVSTKEVARAEALWALNTVKQHYSYSSSAETMDIVKVCINSSRIL